ncbi:FAD-binding protein [Rhodobacteraceae bacterium CCMM004]|nr:FAD-binding protein [Rhodobacteraceae bacterium CCMM004]
MRPESEGDLAAAVREATGPLRVQGGGTRGAATGPGGGLSVAGLMGISLYEPGALTVVAAAGTPVADLEAALAAENQRLAFEPMDHRALMGTEGTPTIGGVVAMNVSGPRRVQVGACRDFLLGVRFVDGTGTVVKNGGRVMKNVTGYDLVKLLAGSRGTLGVLTEVAFKVLPDVAATATLRLDGLDVGTAVAAMSAALGSPFEVTGAAHLPGDGATLLRLEGFESSVAYRAEQLTRRLARYGTAATVEEAGLWRGIRDAEAFAGTDEDVWRLSVRPSAAPDVAARLSGARLLLDWGGGLIWAGVAPGTDLRARLEGIAGHATLVRAAPETHARLGTLPPEAPAVAALSRGLRAKFDPRGLFSPAAVDA